MQSPPEAQSVHPESQPVHPEAQSTPSTNNNTNLQLESTPLTVSADNAHAGSVINAYTISVYNWHHDTRADDITSTNAFDWTGQDGITARLLTVWGGDSDLAFDVDADSTWAGNDDEMQESVSTSTTVDRDTTQQTESQTQYNSYLEHSPLRLYDTHAHRLKHRSTYLPETQGRTPPYIAVSHIWGPVPTHTATDIHTPTNHVPSVPWPVPLSDPAKWDAILGYCARAGVRWLWMDVICLNQHPMVDGTGAPTDAAREKAAEVPRMSAYFRGADACLVVPAGYTAFSDAYSEVTRVFAKFTGTGIDVGVGANLSDDDALEIWESFEMMNVVIKDAWFARLWTYQEYLLPRAHVLLSGQVLDVDLIRRIIDWYHQLLRAGPHMLTKPERGKDYEFVRPGSELVIVGWAPESMGYDLKQELEERDCIDLAKVMHQTRAKATARAEDRLFALYGLLSDAEKVPVAISSDSNSPGAPSHTAGEALLRAKWTETMHKVLVSGRVWPLLYNAIDPDDISPGTRWMPKFTTPRDHSRGVWHGPLVPSTIPLTNRHPIRMAPTGALHLAVRRIARVVGTSAAIGDGGGELNKIFACAWVLHAKGYDLSPIIAQFHYGLAHADRGAVRAEEVEGAQRAVGDALRAESLQACFGVVEQEGLRGKLVYGDGVSGWHRTVLCLDVDGGAEGRRKPMVFLAWVHSSTEPLRGRCWVLDVTSEPVNSVTRWVVVNQSTSSSSGGRGTYTKIGTMYAYAVGVPEDAFVRVTLD
ncbi:hypothetical protein BJ138DRAFT_1183587 [Hygrophoropsis aurantiaca]|uniref:Uncharacterized protein n=1 Tax=Hygrophoropsis aurantiaca TaxID=72124 RepID=A0ACB7ZYY9_9AGAM|nr:hypothetical protein BJ138DRAFT_1183587 [Hygrophoropsis aurantiaca]